MFKPHLLILTGGHKYNSMFDLSISASICMYLSVFYSVRVSICLYLFNQIVSFNVFISQMFLLCVFLFAYLLLSPSLSLSFLCLPHKPLDVAHHRININAPNKHRVQYNHNVVLYIIWKRPGCHAYGYITMCTQYWAEI